MLATICYNFKFGEGLQSGHMVANMAATGRTFTEHSICCKDNENACEAFETGVCLVFLNRLDSVRIELLLDYCLSPCLGT